jgi:hypothetical protein
MKTTSFLTLLLYQKSSYFLVTDNKQTVQVFPYTHSFSLSFSPSFFLVNQNKINKELIFPGQEKDIIITDLGMISSFEFCFTLFPASFINMYIIYIYNIYIYIYIYMYIYMTYIICDLLLSLADGHVVSTLFTDDRVVDFKKSGGKLVYVTCRAAYAYAFIHCILLYNGTHLTFIL